MDKSPADLTADIAARTDVYFNRTRQVVQRFGDRQVTYAVFLRRPVVSAPRRKCQYRGKIIRSVSVADFRW